jgi:hypothetical protein
VTLSRITEGSLAPWQTTGYGRRVTCIGERRVFAETYTTHGAKMSVECFGMRHNLSIDTDPQQQEAAPPRMLVVRSFSR